jgi:molybdate transport system substrate-binding protein
VSIERGPRSRVPSTRYACTALRCATGTRAGAGNSQVLTITSPVLSRLSALWLLLRAVTSVTAAVCLCLVAGPPASSASRPATKPRPKPTTTMRRVAPTSTTLTSTTSVAATVTTTAAPTPPLTGTLDVFAAASLSASFTDIARAFEKANPSVHVRLNTAGSSTLVTQLLNGASADIFASADAANMDRVRDAKLLDGASTVFAHNTLMIVVPRGNPLRVRLLADLARPEVFVALGAPGVPAGDYARDILRRAGVDVTPKTLESNVKAIVNKAALKEIDAGIVYATDVDLDEYRVDGVVIPVAQNVITSYPIAALNSSDHTAARRAFVTFVQGPTAQAILAKYKFLPPT